MASQSYFQRAVNRINSLPLTEADPMENPQNLYWSNGASSAFRMAKRIGIETGVGYVTPKSKPGAWWLPGLKDLREWATAIWNPQIVITYTAGQYTVWYLRPETLYQTYNSRIGKTERFGVGWIYWHDKDGWQHHSFSYAGNPSNFPPETYRYPRVTGGERVAVGPHLTAICNCGNEVIVSNYQGDDLDRIFDGHWLGAVCIAESKVRFAQAKREREAVSA